MISTVVLYGSLGKRFGRRWRLDVRTPAEAVNAINHLRPGFSDAILRMRDVDFGVTVGKRQINEKLLTFPSGGKTITITPVARGAAGKGWISVIAGVVLIAAGIALSGTPLGVVSPYIVGLGISLVLGGVAQLLSPTPTTQAPNANAQKPSYQFSNIVNNIGEGECVPCLYGGPLWIGSYVVSGAYENVDISQGSTSTHTTSSTGASGGAQPIVVQRETP